MTLTAQYRPYRDEEYTDTDPNDDDQQHCHWPDNEPTIEIYEKTTESLKSFTNRHNNHFIHHNNDNLLIKNLRRIDRRSLSILSIIFSTLIFIGFIGYLIGVNYSEPTNCSANNLTNNEINSDQNSDPNQNYDENIIKTMIAKIDIDKIRENVLEFSNQKHLAGSEQDLLLVTRIYKHFEDNNFDRIIWKNYTTLVSLPNENDTNFVSILDANNNEIYTNKYVEKSLQSYCPYSPNADILTSDIIFVNYGRPIDYVQIQTLMNTTSNDIFNGKIFLIKQYHLSSNEQYKYAQMLNASAILFYPDPEHYNPKLITEKSIWLPFDGIRNDGIYWNGAGDPETIGQPSNYYSFRNGRTIRRQLQIPAQPISSEMARKIFENMNNGLIAPKEWFGKLNCTYRLFNNDTNIKFQIHINNRLVHKNIYNVIGMINGSVESDRYLMVGNQRDSMTKGAIDSASGTSIFMELARLFGENLKKNYRPKRTIIFCSWDAEEFNLQGSTEFVEDYYKLLFMRTVAYININLVINGNDTISVQASPLLYHSIFNATKNVFTPNNKTNENNYSETIYDQWLSRVPKIRNKSTLLFQNLGNNQFELNERMQRKNQQKFHLNESNDSGNILKTFIQSSLQEIRPNIRLLDLYGSYSSFYTMIGVPIIDLCFINLDNSNQNNDNNGEHNDDHHVIYPLLHSQYDNIEILENFLDTNYQYHRLSIEIFVNLIENLSNSLFIPFNLFDYAQMLYDFYMKTLYIHNIIMIGHDLNHNQDPNINIQHQPLLNQFNSSMNDEFIQIMDMNLRALESAIKNFTHEAIEFHRQQDMINLNDQLKIRQMNDKLLLIERQFLDHRGLPSNNLKKHLILSPPSAEIMMFTNNGKNNDNQQHQHQHQHHHSDNDGLFPAIIDELDQLMGTLFLNDMMIINDNNSNIDDYGDNVNNSSSSINNNNNQINQSNNIDDDIRQSLWRLQKHMPILIHTIQSAANYLSDDPFQ